MVRDSSPCFSREQYDVMVEDATVDAYGEDEQLESWVAYLDDELQFPFEVNVVGQVGQATKVDLISGRVKLAMHMGNNEYWVDIPEVESVDASSHNSLLLAIFCAWDFRRLQLLRN